MTLYDNANQTYSLAPSDEATASSPVSGSSIGNVFSIAAGQSLSVAVEAAKIRWVLISNIGSIALTVTDNQRPFPFGLRLPCGDTMEIITRRTLYVAAPPVLNTFGMPIAPTVGYVTVSIAE